MSLEDLNSFHNGNDGGLTSYAKCGEEMDNIFEEIEELLKHNEGLEIPANAIATATANTPITETPILQPAGNNDTDAVNLDFLPACNNQAFLISTDTQTMPEEELSLYSVNQNELQPVNAPFMVPGIYKKISTNAPFLANNAAEGSYAAADSSNVYFTTTRAKGKIIARNQYENCSTADETNAASEGNFEGSSMEETVVNGAESSTYDALLLFASKILDSAPGDQLEIDRKLNEITRQQANSDRIIVYRLLGPENIELRTDNIVMSSTARQRRPQQHLKLKRGRPRKQQIGNANEQTPTTLCKKSKIEQNAKVAEPTEPINVPQQPTQRTRSGRMVKTILLQSHVHSTDEPPTSPLQPTKDLIKDAKDKDFTMPIEIDNLVSPPSTSDIVNKRRVPPEAICPKCGKIFLGRRLKRHFTQHPDHMLGSINQQESTVQDPTPQDPQAQVVAGLQNPNDETTLFRFLISKLKNPLLNEDQRADLFLNELNDLINQLQLRSTRLIRNTSGLHFVTARTARVLGIPEGQYALDMSAIDTDAPFIESLDHQAYNGEEQHKRSRLIAASVSTPSIDYTAISLDGTLTDEAAQKLNLSAGGKLLPPSEESLLRAVGDDLVHDGITKLVDANLLQPPRAVVQSSVATSLVSSNYDHASDNAVEALTIKENNATHGGTPLLGLSVDFFQFKNN